MKPQVPTSEVAKRIATLFRRKLTTPWPEKEIKAFRKLNGVFDSLEDLELIERYYASERKKGEKGHHRRDLYTFINNFHGELDRARAWGERAHPKKVQRAVKVTRPEWTPEQIEENKRKCRALKDELVRKLRAPDEPKTFG